MFNGTRVIGEHFNVYDIFAVRFRAVKENDRILNKSVFIQIVSCYGSVSLDTRSMGWNRQVAPKSRRIHSL